jgi:transposase
VPRIPPPSRLNTRKGQQIRHGYPRGEGVAAYQGAKTAAAIAKTGTWKLAIVKRDELHRFIVLPKRWVVERTLAWISHNRRLARDFERYARSAAAFIRLANDPHHAPTIAP